MTCTPFRTPSGGAGFVCGRTRKRPERCQVIACKNEHAFLCDWPDKAKASGTCDKRLCRECTTREGDKDYCPLHAKERREAAARAGKYLPRN